MAGLLVMAAAAEELEHVGSEDEDEPMDFAAYEQAALDEQEQREFEAMPKMQQAVHAVVKYGMGRNEAAREYKVPPNALSK
jgi:helix-turn-helix, Psq domain